MEGSTDISPKFKISVVWCHGSLVSGNGSAIYLMSNHFSFENHLIQSIRIMV